MADDQFGNLTSRLASLSYLRGDVSDLKTRLIALEKIRDQVEELAMRTGELMALSKELEREHKGGIGDLLNELIHKSRGTPLFGLQEHFQCEECGSTHLVAARIMCTECDHEAWFGWSAAEAPARQKKPTGSSSPRRKKKRAA